MGPARAREVLEKVRKSYRVKLGLAQFYSTTNCTHPIKQKKKAEKYAEIVEAFDILFKENT
jgi:hypothetical protein